MFRALILSPLRVLALIGVLVLVAATVPRISSAEHHPKKGKTGHLIVESNPEAFGPIRERIHSTAAEVPAFPMDDRLLASPSTWPATMTIGGEKVVRKIFAWDGAVGAELTTLKQRQSNMRLVLSYAKEHSDDDDDVTWGPRYSWNARGQLSERIYYEPAGKRLVTHDYTYSRDGTLLGYSWRSEARDPEHRARDSEFLSEFYDADGQLVAVAYEKKHEGETESLYTWNGETIPFDQFRMKSHVLYANAAR
jgi:hypothetical protein